MFDVPAETIACDVWLLWLGTAAPLMTLQTVCVVVVRHVCCLMLSCVVVQGMAFVAGVILMYLPEEPAFRVLCQLLDGSGQLAIWCFNRNGL